MPPGVPPVPQGPGSRPTEKVADFPSFKIETVKPGTGAALEFGQKGKFHYVGTFPNGKQFDSSIDRGEPTEFVLGGNIIKGWVLGLEGMKVGEKRRLIVPPELAYGKYGNGAIPPDATLVFDIELVGLPEAAASQPSSSGSGATGDGAKK
jgi:peptidylprolyl isomerase